MAANNVLMLCVLAAAVLNGIVAPESCANKSLESFNWQYHDVIMEDSVTRMELNVEFYDGVSYCTKDKTFGFDGRTVFVDGGCRGQFTICTEKTCASKPCHNEATCTDSEDGFSCACQAGYSGDGLHYCSVCNTGRHGGTPANWKVLSGKCFRWYPNGYYFTWSKGRNACVNNVDAQFALPTSSEENASVQNYITRDTWLDIKKSEGVYKDGNGRDLTWTNWGSGEPIKDCAYIIKASGKWGTYDCHANANLELLCAKDPVS